MTRGRRIGAVSAICVAAVMLGAVTGRVTAPTAAPAAAAAPAAQTPPAAAAPVRLVERLNAFGVNTADMSSRACAVLSRGSLEEEATRVLAERGEEARFNKESFGRGGTSISSLARCTLNGDVIVNAAVADLDRDNLPELITSVLPGDGGPPNVIVYWNNGGAFKRTVVPALTVAPPKSQQASSQKPPDEVAIARSVIGAGSGLQLDAALVKVVAVADVNDDGHQDLVLTPSMADPTMRVLFLDGSRTLPQASVAIPSEAHLGFPNTAITEDFNDDGIADIGYTVRSSVRMQNLNRVYGFRVFMSTGGEAPYYQEETSRRVPLSKSSDDTLSLREVQRSKTQNHVMQPFAVAAADFDKDDDLDLFIGGDLGGSRYYRNDDGVWVDATKSSGMEISATGMGVRTMDVNGDGNLDVFSTEISWDQLVCTNSSTGCDPSWIGNYLFLGDGTGKFVDAAADYGLKRTGWAWGFSSTDFDSDGYADFFIGTGEMAGESVDVGWEGTFSRPYLMMGGPTGWVDRTSDIFRSLSMPGTTAMVASADFDGDMRPDLVVFGEESSAPHLLLNRTPPSGNTAMLLVRGLGKGASPRNAESAVVSVDINGRPRQTFTVPGQFSNFRFHGANAPIPIGLGDQTHAVVTVTFPSGRVLTRAIAKDVVNVLTEPAA